MTNRILVLSASSLLLCSSLLANNVITFFLRPYVPCPASLEKTAQNICVPGKVSLKAFKHVLETPAYVQALFTSYAGYIKTPDQNGQIIFPRKHQKPHVKILVTTFIKPVMMIGRTIHHWEIDPNIQASLYTAEKTQNADSKKYTWNITQQALPANNIISSDTIIIFSKPRHVVVPIGQFPTKTSAHLYLPDIYVKKSAHSNLMSLWILKIKNFFNKPDYATEKQSPKTISLHIVP